MSWDITWVLWLNDFIAQSERLFFWALFLSDRVPWVLSSLTLVALWFARRQAGEQVQEFHDRDPVYRQRIRVFSVGLGALLAFIVARPMAYYWNRPRPFLVMPIKAPIDPQIWAEIMRVLGSDGAFPSDHTAFWGAITAGVFLTSPWWGIVALIATTFFAAVRVALGYHYPTDMIAGFFIGTFCVLLVYGFRHKLRWLFDPWLLLFNHQPAWAYALSLMVLLDITQRMAWFFGIMATAFGLYFPR